MGEDGGDGLGTTVIPLPDVNGCGLPDFGIAAPYARDNDGLMYVLTGELFSYLMPEVGLEKPVDQLAFTSHRSTYPNFIGDRSISTDGEELMCISFGPRQPITDNVFEGVIVKKILDVP